MSQGRTDSDLVEMGLKIFATETPWVPRVPVSGWMQGMMVCFLLLSVWPLPCSNTGLFIQGIDQADSIYSTGYTQGLAHAGCDHNIGSNWVLESLTDGHLTQQLKAVQTCTKRTI